MSYSAAAVANAFIDIAANNGFYLTNLKLQKLVYFAHGWYLAFTDTPLIDDEVQSWKYGPVIQSLYYELKHYGSDPITKKIPTDKNIAYESEDWNFICSVYRKYSIFSPAQLIAMTHEPGSPWEQFGAGKNDFQVIPQEKIKKYFKEMMNNDRK